MAKGSKVEDDLAALIAAAGPSEPPKDLGNLPPDDVSPIGDEPVADAAEAPPEPAVEDADEGDEPSAFETRMAALEDRLISAERENEVLRAGRAAPTPQPAADPLEVIRNYFPGNVTAQDLEAILADPVKGAEYMTAFGRASALAGARMALDASREEMRRELNQREETRSVRERFWAANDDLQPYGKVVQSVSNEIYAEGITQPDRFIKEVSRRTREQLREWGVKVAPASAAGAKVARRAIKPAFAEGAQRGGRAAPVNKIEQDIFRMSQNR
jgi:hypothetical protein